MTASIELSPLGTARAALLAHGEKTGGSPQEAAMFAWLGKLREPLETEYNLEREILAIAWELARWQPGLSLKEHQALLLLILLALAQEQRGSTRLALRAPGGEELRLDFARRLLARVQSVEDSSTLDPSAAATLMSELIESGRAGALFGRASDFKPLVVAGDHLYLQKMLHLEDRFAAAVRRKLEVGVPIWPEREIENALNDVLARPRQANGTPLKLNEEQIEAVRASVRTPITIISGGPGTGKTTIVVSILRVLGRLGVSPEEIALAAPTGKAANRMQVAIQQGLEGIAGSVEADRQVADRPEPRTLHRLLGYSPSSGRFHHHENNRLAERIVIVDEASMIDLALMERLVRSLRDDGRLVLLGDEYQLPSVEAGAVLRDLLKAWGDDPRPGAAAVTLKKNQRVQPGEDGSNLLAVARKVREGETPSFDVKRSGDDVVVERGSVDELKFQGVEFIASSLKQTLIDQFLDRWDDESRRAQPALAGLTGHTYVLSNNGEFSGDHEAKLSQLFEFWESFRILCVTRVLPTGSDRINEISHRRALERLESPAGDNRFIAGEPVMMQVNDYARMIFNGDQGLILNVAGRAGARPQPMAVFQRPRTWPETSVAFRSAKEGTFAERKATFREVIPGQIPSGFAAFHLEALRSSLVLSYAMTVHKAQGSEFDRVALVLPDRDVPPIHTREILYTALTRAKKSAVIVGDRAIFESGIKRICERDSGIVEKLCR